MGAEGCEWGSSSHRKRWLLPPDELAKRRRREGAAGAGGTALEAWRDFGSLLVSAADRLGYGGGVAASAAVLWRRASLVLGPQHPRAVALWAACLLAAARVHGHRLEVGDLAEELLSVAAVPRAVTGSPGAWVDAVAAAAEELADALGRDLVVHSPLQTLLVIASEAHTRRAAPLGELCACMGTARAEALQLLCTDAALLHPPQRIAAAALALAAAAHRLPQLCALPLCRSIRWGGDAGALLAAALPRRPTLRYAAAARRWHPRWRCRATVAASGAAVVTGRQALQHISGYLAVREAAAAQLVCTEWRDALAPPLWGRVAAAAEQAAPPAAGREEPLLCAAGAAELRALRSAALQLCHARRCAVGAPGGDHLSPTAAEALAGLLAAAAAGEPPPQRVALRGAHPPPDAAGAAAALEHALGALRHRGTQVALSGCGAALTDAAPL
eukprot:TRINITY_DN615_c1_g1_i1.p2 TRINITY_DN615_c1_g1~~TRINITY_DN615_c1_g1_i1.p2  ORF type:complete len:451 (+),score=123.29 TRINITY_DN615_c1_g1_i1:23-1354(+)